MSLTFPQSAGDSGQQSVSEFHENDIKPYPYILSLDVLRGIAVMGALFISIWMFGGFTANRQNSLLLSSQSRDHPLFVLVSMFFEGKMRAIISIVFGAGMILFLTTSNKKNNVPLPDLFIRKQLYFVIFGLINGLLLLNTGDILFHLGVFGIMMYPFARLSFRGLLIAAILITFIYSAKNLWKFSDDHTAYTKYLSVVALEKKNAAKKSDSVALSQQQKNDKSAWEATAAGFTFDPKKEEANNKAMRSATFAKVWNYLVPSLQRKESTWTYSSGIWDITGMIFLGMALFKSGFFHSRLSKRWYLLLAIGGLSAGIFMSWFRLHFNHMAAVDYVTYIKEHTFPFDLLFPFERLLTSLGYCSAVVLLIRVSLLKIIWNAFAASGRMALTNYLVQSIFLTLFFTGFGMGYYGMLKQYQLYFLAAEICLAQTVFSIFWLKFYQAGPAEWLLRCLMYRKWLPNKISTSLKTKESLVILAL